MPRVHTRTHTRLCQKTHTHMVGVIPLVNSDNHRGKRGDEGERQEEEEEEETGRWRTDDSVEERERETLSAAQTPSKPQGSYCLYNESFPRIQLCKDEDLHFIFY